MLKDLFSNRLFIGALAIFIFCVGGSLLYMQHVQRVDAEKLAETQARVRQWNEKQNPTTAEVPEGETSQGGHVHADGTFHAEPHDAPVVEVSESEVSADVLAAPVVVQQADTQIDAATLESAERRLKDPEVSKAWVEWSKEAKELREKYSQASKEVIAVGPQTDEDVKRYKNDPEWQRRCDEAYAKMGKIYGMMIAHDKENPLLQ